MKIKWLGHASVLITSDSGLKIVTDPYLRGHHAAPGGDLYYESVTEPTDIIAITHEHPDHNFISTIPGTPAVVRGNEIKGRGKVNVKGIEFWAIPTFHDIAGGKILGENSLLCFEVDGMKICHNGDLGHTLTQAQISEMGKLDVFLFCIGQLIPVGERHYVTRPDGKKEPYYDGYIINADLANRLQDQISARVIVPIHYANERCTFKLVSVDEYLKGKNNIIRMDSTEVELKKSRLPADTQIIVLKPAL